MWERAAFSMSPCPISFGKIVCGAAVADSPATNAAGRVVMHSPSLDHHLRLLQRIEDLALQTFILQLAVCRSRHPRLLVLLTVGGHLC